MCVLAGNQAAIAAKKLFRKPSCFYFMKKILVLGVNGFIGHHLVKRILSTTQWEVYGMDLSTHRLGEWARHARMHITLGDITQQAGWIDEHIRQCDVVLPLVAIATPATYVTQPLQVFELDFEANLPIVRATVAHRKHLVFPSTSEVYGMCPDTVFDPDQSPLVCGPVNKPRWIYACSKQLMDRVIWAYGMQAGLNFTLFRPFNWIGPGLDSMEAAQAGRSRVVTRFLYQIAQGEPIHLVDGGGQKRAFTDIDDGIDALMRIIENPQGVVSGKIYNIGNPANCFSIRELARKMCAIAPEFAAYAESVRRVNLVEVASGDYYGKGYQDVQHRVPEISNTMSDLDWTPKTDISTAIRKIFAAQ